MHFVLKCHTVSNFVFALPKAGSTTLKLMLSCKFDEMMINLEENINLQLKSLFLKKEKKLILYTMLKGELPSKSIEIYPF